MAPVTWQAEWQICSSDLQRLDAKLVTALPVFSVSRCLRVEIANHTVLSLPFGESPVPAVAFHRDEQNTGTQRHRGTEGDAFSSDGSV